MCFGVVIGAISLDRHNGAAGYSYNYATLDRASARALQSCRAHGGRRCQRVTWYRNGCGAVAWSRNGAWGSFGRARTLAVARSRAMRECRRRGSTRVRAVDVIRCGRTSRS